jgi:hypothetical protein
MNANIILAIVLVLGIICVVFQRPVVNFLFRYCALGKLLDKLGTCFLSRHEKELSKQEERIRNATEEELLAQWLSIVKEHAGKYNENCAVPEKLSKYLPEELLKFFTEYDFLNIGGIVILDKMALKQIKVGGIDYIVIGQDAPDSLFVIQADIVNGRPCQVFMIDSELECQENLEVNTRPESAYRSIRQFVCLMSLYYGEQT